jgi:hypothetical protein
MQKKKIVISVLVALLLSFLYLIKFNDELLFEYGDDISFTINALGEKSRASWGTDVRIGSIVVDGKVQDLSKTPAQGSWKYFEGALVSFDHQPSILELNYNGAKKVEINFTRQCGSGFVEIKSGNNYEKFDLYSEEWQDNYKRELYNRKIGISGVGNLLLHAIGMFFFLYAIIRYTNLYLTIFYMVIFSSITAITIFQPQMADDYSLKVLLTKHNTLLDYCMWYYFFWLGNMQPISLGWFAMQSEITRLVFQVLNTVVFFGISFLIFFLSFGKWPQVFNKSSQDRIAITLITIIIWFAFPAISETVFWFTGSLAYLWTLFFGLLFLVPYRHFCQQLQKGIFSIRKSQNKIYVLNFLMFILGIWVGLSHILVIVTVSFLLLLFYAFAYSQSLVKFLPPWLQWGGVGLTFGSVILIVAPGNYVRLAHLTDMTLIQRIISWCEMIIAMEKWPCLIAFFIFILHKYEKDEKQGGLSRPVNKPFFLVWLSASVVSLLPFIYLTVFTVERAKVFCMVFIVIALISQIKDFYVDNYEKYKSLIIPSVCIITLFFGADVFIGLKQSFSLFQEMKEREHIIYKEKAKGVLDVTVPPFTTVPYRTTHIYDISNNTEGLVNKDVAEWYGINSIRLNNE